MPCDNINYTTQLWKNFKINILKLTLIKCVQRKGGEESNSYLKSCHPIKNKNFENKLVQQVKKKVFISIKTIIQK